MAQAFFRGHHTESFGTPIIEAIPPVASFIPRITGIDYTTAATLHTCYLMPTLGTTTTTAASNAAGTSITIANLDPAKDVNGTDEDLAANDYIGWIDENGVFQYDKIITVTGLDLQVTALPSDVPSGTTVYAFYLAARFTADTRKFAAGATTSLRELTWQGGVPKYLGPLGVPRSGVGEPILIYFDNATNAGTLNHIAGYYTGADSTAN